MGSALYVWGLRCMSVYSRLYLRGLGCVNTIVYVPLCACVSRHEQQHSVRSLWL